MKPHLQAPLAILNWHQLRRKVTSLKIISKVLYGRKVQVISYNNLKLFHIGKNYSWRHKLTLVSSFNSNNKRVMLVSPKNDLQIKYYPLFLSEARYVDFPACLIKNLNSMCFYLSKDSYFGLRYVSDLVALGKSLRINGLHSSHFLAVPY